MSTNKKIAYFSIIFLALGGTIFSIYRNYQIANVGLNEVNQIDMGIITDIPMDSAIIPTTTDKGSVASQAKNDFAGLDISIFSDPKFLKLQDFSVVQSYKADVGKNNPFEPK